MQRLHNFNYTPASCILSLVFAGAWNGLLYFHSDEMKKK